ncbi:hypothetical protein JQK15_11565 [Sphingobium sp. BHU LFT2]|nr:hypothetical protein [Sphingobium sp. BHU LFT2]MBT2244173.1 hypothetical protein [Sphingobium sp. BHU LFT2]
MKKETVFSQKVRSWTAEDLLKVAGGNGTLKGPKQDSGQDNTGKTGFYQS